MTVVKSTIGLKYPPLRDNHLKTGREWLRGKQMVDGAEGFWRIHNNLYNLTDFVQTHPGGKEWLELTKGTDITEAFEAHHIKGVAENLLPKYFIREAKSPRNSPFTFEDSGFYRTLKRNIAKELPNVPQSAARQSKLMTDLLLITYFIVGLSAIYFHSFLLGLLAGLALACTAIAAHNFFHQKNNIRMYYFDFILMESKGWRISHALSHHLYTNTVDDLEISFLEPFIYYLPVKKGFIFKLFQLGALPFFSLLMTYGYAIHRFIEIAINKEPIEKSKFIPLLFLIPAMLIGNRIIGTLVMYIFIQTVASVHFALVGINAAHHHPDLFHDGDTPRPSHEMDWGVYQLDAVADRKDITGSPFLVLTNFGDHALHHLFPTLDHAYLTYLYPVFLKTCRDFGVEWKFTSQKELIKGQFKQLFTSEPNRVAPKTLGKFNKG